MKLPSIQYLYISARSGLVRFPLTILAAIIAAITAICLIESEDPINYTLFNLMLTAALGIPAYVFAGILSQRIFSKKGRRWGCYGVVTLILLLIFFTLPDDAHNTFQPYIRYTIYNIIFHLAVAFAPYFKAGELNGFWNYNKTLFIRFLTALLYSGVLYTGLALAILTVDLLFVAEFDHKLYFELFAGILWIFTTWFFVYGLPDDFRLLELETTYPRGLKIFTQYILIPLLALYIIILYVYGLKIIFTWNWPQGIVSYLIMIVAVAGILTMLLIHPYAKLPDSGWINQAKKGYYLLLYPLVVLLFFAIGMRIATYGVTVNRYIIVLTGIWIIITSTHSLFRPAHIKFIPISLAVLMVLACFGPWSMFAVSERDQISRLHEILSTNHLLENGKIHQEVHWQTDSLPDFYSNENLRNNTILTDSLHNEVVSIMIYLNRYHGYSEIQPWFSQNIDSLLQVAENRTPDSIYYRPYAQETEVYMNSLGLQADIKYTYNNRDNRLSFQRQNGLNYTTTGFNNMIDLGYINLQIYSNGKIKQDYEVTPVRGNHRLSVKLDSATRLLHITMDSLLLEFELQPLIAHLLKEKSDSTQYFLPDSVMQIENPGQKSQFLFTKIGLYSEPDDSIPQVIITELNGFVFYNK